MRTGLAEAEDRATTQELSVVVQVRNCTELNKDGHSRDGKGENTRHIGKENMIGVEWHAFITYHFIRSVPFAELFLPGSEAFTGNTKIQASG